MEEQGCSALLDDLCQNFHLRMLKRFLPGHQLLQLNQTGLMNKGFQQLELKVCSINRLKCCFVLIQELNSLNECMYSWLIYPFS